MWLQTLQDDLHGRKESVNIEFSKENLAEDDYNSNTNCAAELWGSSGIAHTEYDILRELF